MAVTGIGGTPGPLAGDSITTAGVLMRPLATKIMLGNTTVNDGLVSATNPMPVTGAGGGALAVNATIVAPLPLPVFAPVQDEYPVYEIAFFAAGAVVAAPFVAELQSFVAGKQLGVLDVAIVAADTVMSEINLFKTAIPGDPVGPYAGVQVGVTAGVGAGRGVNNWGGFGPTLPTNPIRKTFLQQIGDERRWTWPDTNPLILANGTSIVIANGSGATPSGNVWLSFRYFELPNPL